MIDSTYFLAQQELVFGGHDKSDLSVNRGNYVELIYLMAQCNELLKTHLATSTILTGLSEDIQNDLIQSISNVLLKQIENEIRDTPFVAIIMDETIDIITKSQLSTVLRYVNTIDGYEVFERFLGFTDVSENQSAKPLSEHTDQLHDRSSVAEHQKDGGAVPWDLTAGGEVCERCRTFCADMTDLWRHARAVHGDADSLHCPFTGCGRRFSAVSTNVSHVEHHATATALRVYTCEICGRLSHNRGSLHKHVDRAHPKARAAMCGVCCLYMGDVASLIDHVHVQHGAVVASEHAGIGGPYLRPKRVARCDVCGKRCRNDTVLRAHRHVHGHVGPVSPPYARVRMMR
ncbi:myoneurin-like [Sipha flava]|uniref:Myoneurin-like n=1 Tax=Sipha flava TaxID=143950 RepID=A0A8B8FV76_9HEMI|nr:myoneurin-like [Sipha flava]